MNAANSPLTNVIDKLNLCIENMDCLNDWEQKRVDEWHHRALNGNFLSNKVMGCIDGFLNDVKASRKPITQEQIDIAQKGVDYPRSLYQREKAFVEQMADYSPGQIKLSKEQRGWLKKIEARINKNLGY